MYRNVATDMSRDRNGSDRKVVYPHVFGRHDTQSVKTVVYLPKRGHNLLLPRLCTKAKKYLSPLNTTVV